MQWRNTGSEEGLIKWPGHSPSQILGSLESFKWQGHDMLYINFKSRGQRSFYLKWSLGRVQTEAFLDACVLEQWELERKSKRITAVVWGRRAEVSKILLLRIAGYDLLKPACCALSSEDPFCPFPTQIVPSTRSGLYLFFLPQYPLFWEYDLVYRRDSTRFVD